MTDNEARLLTQVADVIEEADILRRKLEISEKINRNLRCCWNCVHSGEREDKATFCAILYIDCKHRFVCDQWAYDGLDVERDGKRLGKWPCGGRVKRTKICRKSRLLVER